MPDVSRSGAAGARLFMIDHEWNSAWPQPGLRSVFARSASEIIGAGESVPAGAIRRWIISDRASPQRRCAANRRILCPGQRYRRGHLMWYGFVHNRYLIDRPAPAHSLKTLLFRGLRPISTYRYWPDY